MQLLERCAPLRIVASIKIVVAAAALEAVVATDAEEIVSSVEVLEDVVAIAVLCSMQWVAASMIVFVESRPVVQTAARWSHDAAIDTVSRSGARR